MKRKSVNHDTVLYAFVNPKNRAITTVNNNYCSHDVCQCTNLLKDASQVNQLLLEADDVLQHGVAQRLIDDEIFRRWVQHVWLQVELLTLFEMLPEWRLCWCVATVHAVEWPRAVRAILAQRRVAVVLESSVQQASCPCGKLRSVTDKIAHVWLVFSRYFMFYILYLAQTKVCGKKEIKITPRKSFRYTRKKFPPTRRKSINSDSVRADEHSVHTHTHIQALPVTKQWMKKLHCTESFRKICQTFANERLRKTKKSNYFEPNWSRNVSWWIYIFGSGQ